VSILLLAEDARCPRRPLSHCDFASLDWALDFLACLPAFNASLLTETEPEAARALGTEVLVVLLQDL